MRETPQRAMLYGGAAILLGGIGYAWANRTTDADVLTLLSSAQVQLSMAYAIPAVDRDGHELTSRETMIAAAEAHLATAERIQPGMACTAEFRGFAHMLRGEHEAAAMCYRRSRQCADFDRTQHDVLAFNEARMRIAAGQPELALDVFAQNRAQIDEKYRLERLLAEASALVALGRAEEASQRLDTVMQEAAEAPLARLSCGQQWLEMGRADEAEAALQSAREVLPIADYHLARLKLRQGQADIAIGLLERAAEARPAEVRQLLHKDATAWSAVAAEARVQELTRPTPATPGR